MKKSFAASILAWYDRHGRKDLPWQHPRSAYRVWISEIMLQQTQVATVVPYFERFMRAFPDLAALARATIDEVLAHWQGLGYYQRARNLHRAARECMTLHQGELPRDLAALHALPGIGLSTAGAILAQAYGLPHAVLDGNIKRVLSRYAGIAEEISSAAASKKLWVLAESLLPPTRAADYAQAMMDFGATICTPKNPACDACPLATLCFAKQHEQVAMLPHKKTKALTPRKKTFMLVLENRANAVFLQKRPETGVWGGLWSLPQAETREKLLLSLSSALRDQVEVLATLPAFTHVFTHFKLEITPVLAKMRHESDPCRDHNENARWICKGGLAHYGLPKPVRSLILGLERSDG